MLNLGDASPRFLKPKAFTDMYPCRLLYAPAVGSQTSRWTIDASALRLVRAEGKAVPPSENHSAASNGKAGGTASTCPGAMGGYRPPCHARKFEFRMVVDRERRIGLWAGTEHDASKWAVEEAQASQEGDIVNQTAPTAERDPVIAQINYPGGGGRPTVLARYPPLQLALAKHLVLHPFKGTCLAPVAFTVYLTVMTTYVASSRAAARGVDNPNLVKVKDSVVDQRAASPLVAIAEKPTTSQKVETLKRKWANAKKKKKPGRKKVSRSSSRP